MEKITPKTRTNSIDKIKIISLATTFRLFRKTIKKNYLKRELYNPAVYREHHIFFFRNGQRLITKFQKILEENQYPEISRNQDDLIQTLRSGYSFSRYGDGEYSMIMGKKGQKIYFDQITERARTQLKEVLLHPADNHLVGIIGADVVAKQLTFANALSAFKKIASSGLSCRMPLFAEYDEQMLELYRALGKQSDCLFDAGIFRNSAHQKHIKLWQDKDLLYVTGSAATSEKNGITVSEIFQGANSVEVIETVTEYALSRYYDEIFARIINHPGVKNKMIILSQGMAGTVLAYDLAKAGLHAIDFGQPFVRY